jgi:hypothetical protein
MRDAHNTNIFSWQPAFLVSAAPGHPCYPPDMHELPACYGPVMAPVILLSPRMRVFSEAIADKALFCGRVGQNRVIPPVFSCLQDKTGQNGAVASRGRHAPAA